MEKGRNLKKTHSFLRYEDKEAWSYLVESRMTLTHFFTLDHAPYPELDLASVMESPNATVTHVHGF